MKHNIEWTGIFTFIIDFKAVRAHGEVTGESQREYRPSAGDGRRDLETR